MRDEAILHVNGSGIPVKAVYSADDLTNAGEISVGSPGEYPYTRGIQPTMYRGRLWTMRQYAGSGDAEESNRRYHFLLANGTKGLSVAFDLPTQIGYDSDDPIALGEVGRVGVAIDSVEDMERLFAGIPLDAISTSMTINATASILLAMYTVAARRAGVDVKKLAGTIQNDILKEYIARGTYIYPIKDAMRLVTDVMAWAATEVPAWNPISVSGYHMREAGCTAVQEVAFTLANARAYVQAAIDRGMSVDTFAPRISFFFNAHRDLFEEVAKFRAARRMWAKIMREEFGAEDHRSWMLRFHAQTGGSTLTAQQPENNIVRTTLEALAAVLGGAQSLHTNGFDEALALPTEQAARIALRTQQVIAYETGVTSVADPLGGSFYVEAMTDEIERRAQAYLKTIADFDDNGYGMLRAIETGYVQREIQIAAYAWQRKVDAGEAIVVGVNAFQSDETVAVPVERRDESLERRQVERVQMMRARRNPERHRLALKELREAASGGANLMSPIVNAVESNATVGEISNTLRAVFGEYKENIVL